MAQNLIHYNIFLASPSDVAEERKLIETSINELNITVCKTLNVRLDLIKWETHSYPSVGNYSQEVINDQINDYDFFIGIMWSKVGSPTPNSKSGTIEEFDIAYEKLKNGSDVKILFYFSDKPIPPSEIEPEQILQIKKFRSDLQQKGVYYYNYSKPEEFQSLIKLHISQHLNEVNSKRKIETAFKQKVLKSGENDIFNNNLETDLSDYEEYGLIEYLDIFKDSFADVESSLERLGNYLVELGTNISKRTEKINSFNALPFNTIKDIKKEIDKASNDMFDYVKRTNVEIPLFHEYYYKGMEALSSALTIQEEDGMISYSDLKELSETLNNNYLIFNKTIEQIEGFKLKVSVIPRVSVSIKMAKRKMDQTLDELISELRSAQNLSSEFSKRIDSILDI